MMMMVMMVMMMMMMMISICADMTIPKSKMHIIALRDFYILTKIFILPSQVVTCLLPSPPGHQL